MRSHKIAAVPGRGIGVEVIEGGLGALDLLSERDGFLASTWSTSTEAQTVAGARVR